MATVVLQFVGGAIGAALGGPIGGVIGRAVGAVAGNIIDQSLFGGGERHIKGPRINDLRVMQANEGDPIPRLWGRMRVAGQVIWATNFEEKVSHHTDKSSSKGGGAGPSTKVTEYTYFANFAVALCEGEIDRVGRVWADGKEFDLTESVVRLYRGTETQEPDSLIVAKEGAANAPAYRGTAYMVFERLPIGPYGNRLPQLSFEVIRGAGGAETEVRAVNIIPGSTEFGYDTVVQTRKAGDGVTETENGHASSLRSDWTVSIDDLTASAKNLEAASLVVAWFGSDLRCGETLIRPGVENLTKKTVPESWSVAGLQRASAHAVSQVDGAPAFGGTPSDKSVIRALQDLRARGLATQFYPFILMDIPEGNGLADPYGGTAQARYPWRGRMTCHPAPGQSGSPDKSAACAAQLASFIGTAQPSQFSVSGGAVNYSGPNEWSYRRMVLHYAKLCALAGGVDAFLIGSELRGLTTLRGAANSFPFVDALVTLAQEVKAILPATKVSYAADWSEYFGFHPQDNSGDHFFHLDPLWSSVNVDFIGIDNYMPLADWRDGYQHTDRLAGWTSIYDTNYLASNIAGGEGFDWYCASAAARQTQSRTPITDGAYGKPWVFRYKDLKSWWLNPHHDRVGGAELAAATTWVPQSKPFWFTEAGCAAVDKAANQPNAFVDTKSSESLLPYFSNGQRDDLIQSRYVKALARYWGQGSTANPLSAIYGGRMVEQSRIFLWAWDARPFPFFPARTDTWADGANYARGHWLNGRIGAVLLDRLIERVAGANGFAALDVTEVEGLVDGFLIDRNMSARDALEELLSAFAIDGIEQDGLIRFRMRKQDTSAVIAEAELVETDANASLYTLTRAQETELAGAARIDYIESAVDYRRATVEAHHVPSSSSREISAEIAAAIGQSTAQMRAEVALEESWAGRDGWELALPPSRLELMPGDVVTFDLAVGPRNIRIERVSDGEYRKVKGRSYQAQVYESPGAPGRGETATPVFPFGTPDACFLDLPVAISTAVAYAPWIAASAKPWPGILSLYRSLSGASLELDRQIEAQATKGRLLGAMPAGPLYVFDRKTSFEVKLDFGALASVREAELLQGVNAAAVGSTETGWEIIQFAIAELVAADTYRLSMLLRGQSGSEPEMLSIRPAGSRFVLLNGAVVQPVETLADAGLPQSWRIGPAQYDVTRNYLTIDHQSKKLGLRPLSPCQLRGSRDGGDVVFSWLRRTRIDGDSWEVAEVPLGEESESYRLDILDGSTVKRSVTVASPSYRYAAASIASDFGAGANIFTLRVGQMSAAYGRGANLQETINV